MCNQDLPPPMTTTAAVRFTISFVRGVSLAQYSRANLGHNVSVAGLYAFAVASLVSGLGGAAEAGLYMKAVAATPTGKK
jgi:hypothetical protein